MELENNQTIDIERINFTAVAGDTVKVTHRTRVGNKRIIGICVAIHEGAAAIPGSTMRVLIDRKEIIPKDFEVGLITFTQDTPVDKRFFSYINREINNSDIEVEYTDNNAGSEGQVSIFLKCVHE